MAAAQLPSMDELIALSVELAPLRSADETATLASAMNTFPAGMPHRAAHITASLQDARSAPQYCAKQIGDLIERLSAPAASGWRSFIQCCLPGSGRSVVLMPSVRECVACSRSGMVTVLRDGVRESTPTVYAERGQLAGRLFIKLCHCCGARHYVSYAEGGSRLVTHTTDNIQTEPTV